MMSVSIPAGVDSGTTLRLAGKGEASPAGGTPGHLYVILRVEEDDRFLRDDSDVLTEVPISYLTAILGGDIEIPTLEEECEGADEISVNAGTQPGDHIVRRGKGVPRVNGRGRGDHVVRFQVEIPKKITKAERELLEKLDEQAKSRPAKKSWFRR